MTETAPANETVTDPNATVTDTDTTDWKVEAEKWKGFSRKHEDNWKANSKELEALRASQMTDSEKAIADAESRGRASGLSEAGTRLANAELRAAAATAGVAIPETLSGLLDVSRLLTADGTPDVGAINALVASLGTAKPPAPTFAQNTGVGPQGTSTTGQLTHDDLRKMSPIEINKARKEGLLNHLMFGG